MVNKVFVFAQAGDDTPSSYVHEVVVDKLHDAVETLVRAGHDLKDIRCVPCTQARSIVVK